ncbi:16120_t:CDS:2, partial [Dentiscutata heterogama]
KPRYSASQGLVERANGILKIKLRKTYNKKLYKLVFDGLLHGYSVVLDYLFETSIFLEDKIPNEFGLENIQESINDLDDLIDNTNSVPLIKIEFASSSTSLNQDLSLNNEN